MTEEMITKAERKAAAIRDAIYEQTEAEQREQSETTKPSLGIMPEIFYKEQRMRDLATAINRYISCGKYSVNVEIWCEELARRLKEYSGR